MTTDSGDPNVNFPVGTRLAKKTGGVRNRTDAPWVVRSANTKTDKYVVIKEGTQISQVHSKFTLNLTFYKIYGGYRTLEKKT